METTIYSNKKIKTIKDLQKIVSICYDPPEDRCICNECFKYEVTIEKIKGIQRNL